MESPVSVKFLMILLFGLGIAPAMGTAEPREAAPKQKSPIYTFDHRADELLVLLYPRHVTPPFFTNGFASREEQKRFRNLDEVYLHHLHASRPSSLPPTEVDLGDDNIDSYWNLLEHDQVVAARFLKHCRKHRLENLLEHFRTSDLEYGSVLEKALFQRDVALAWSLLYRATKQVPVPELTSYGADLKEAIRALVPKIALTPDEYQRLLVALPETVDRDLFADRFDNRERPYLPGQVLAPEDGWYEVPFRRQASQHFKRYGGRSFVHISIKVPGMTEEDFQAYWDRLFDIAGVDLTVTSHLPPLPANTETLLVRTFGVFLTDGRYADSRIPEAVLMRIMKYPQQKLDLDSSDYRGTEVLSYALKRRSLLENPASLGLRANGYDDLAFLGFFEKAPDPFSAGTATVTTVRHNCTNCHNELLHGASTLFSLSRKRPRDDSAPYRMSGMLEPIGEDGFYRLATEEGRALLSGLGGSTP